nr:recombinase family protein [Clostridia bacterium]
MNAVIYARYSSYGQQEQSIEGQIRDCRAYCEREGFKVVGEYIDRAISGRTDDRPDFQRMIADSSKKQFSYVVVWKLDRFARNRYDSAMYKAKLKKNGVKVLSAMEPISDSPESIIMEGLLESMAEYYSANLSENVKRGQRESILKHNWTGGGVPYGYRVQDKKLLPRDDTAPIVKEIFEKYASGISKKEICEDLNRRGLRTYAGCTFTKASLETMLKNKKYIGIFSYGELSYEDEGIRLISDDLFNKVQKKLSATKRAPAEGKAKVEYLLRGKAFCGHCGSRLVGECGRSKTGEVHYYYACAKKKKSHSCKKKNEQKGFLEWYVVEQTMAYILDPARLDHVADAVVKAYDKEFNTDEIKGMERELTRIEKEANAAVDFMVSTDRKDLQQRYQQKLEQLEDRKADIESELSKLRIAVSIRYTHEQVVAWLKTICRGDPTDEDFQRRIIDIFINSVYVFDDKIVIFYNIRDGKQVSYIEATEALEDLEEIPGEESRGESTCSDLNGSALPIPIKSEYQRRMIFAAGCFGFVFPRD